MIILVVLITRSEGGGCQSRPSGSGSPFKAIEVFDNKNNQTTTYDSIHEAAIALNIPHSELLCILVEINRSHIKVNILSKNFKIITLLFLSTLTIYFKK